jgi:hypothetical protein
MKKNRFDLPENLSGKRPATEKLRLENEILRIKLKAQTGGDLRQTNRELPPEIEHIFLKNILAFEESLETSTLISIYDYIGQPEYAEAAEMTDEEISARLASLTDVMFKKNITIDFGSLTEERDKYAFITEDLFFHEINDVKIGGMFLHFQYEEFNLNHEKDMRSKAMEFISDWFERSMGKFSWELADQCLLPDGQIMLKQELLKKFKAVFDNYSAFRDCQYLIKDIIFELNEEEHTGSGHVEGAVIYNGLLENGEKEHFDGPFKLFMKLESNCWRICYFLFPGFEW